MRTFHVSTFCSIEVPEISLDKVMQTIEIVMVMNQDTPPDPAVIEGLIKMIAPNVSPILSEVSEIPHVPNLRGR